MDGPFDDMEKWVYANIKVHRAVIATAFVGAHHELLREPPSPDRQVRLINALVDFLERWDAQPKDQYTEKKHEDHTGT